MKKYLIGLLAVLCMVSCDKGYHRTDRGVIVDIDMSGNYERIDQTSRVMLEVMGEKLIHVKAIQNLEFPKDSSLIIVPNLPKVPFKVESTDDSVFVMTNSLIAGVERKTGNVRFQNAITGEVILQELDNGRTFEPKENGNGWAYSVQQSFFGQDGEGLYGLGQHQADEFNYKDKNEELFQYNTKVSVPFIMSTKGYGILWDNYSLTRFGHPDDYQQLGDVFALYNKVGEQGFLTGTYQPAKGKTIVRNEPNLFFEHLDRENGLQTVVNLPQDFNFAGAKVSYEGELEAFEEGTFQFILYYAGYMKVYIDNELVVPERWRTAWNPNSYKFSVEMQPERRVPIRIEWEPDGSVSYCGLRVHQPVENRGFINWWSEVAHAVDYYFVDGDSMDEVISGYRTLTGKSPIMPKWAMGYWQSREKYNNQDELVSTLREFRSRQIPIDNIVQDWFYWREDQWGSHEFDPARFPNPKQMVDDVHNMGGHIMISVWPKFYVNTEHYKEFDKNGWMYQQAVNDDIHDWVGPGYVGSFYDAYSAPARKLFWQQMKDHLYPLGFDAWWMDASEPNIRDCTDIEYRKLLCGPTALGTSDEYFNAYALMNAEAIYDGQREADNDKRVFLLTRSGFAGLQRYSTATWSGDIATRWEDMKAQISAGLNFATSGIPYWTMDIGGFCVENRYVAAQQLYDHTGVENADLKEWRELNTRWYQFGAFCPLFRAHGQFPLREVWNIAPASHPAYKSIVDYTKLRYRLMPYIYSLAGITYFKDYTIMRPLVMDFTADKRVYDIGDQYMFGPAFMVAPIYKYGARTKEMYFPAGKGWYNFYTGRYVQGGQQLTVEAPYERMPLFVKAGSIVPFGPEMQYAMEKQPKEIVLYVYAGADADFTLYEDEGVNYGYEQGKYATISMHYSDAAGKLTIGQRQGTFPGMLQQRVFKVVKVSKDKPVAFDLNVATKSIEYDGNAVDVVL
jgi:alpha-D-xyloside xylohydrolase